MKFCSLITRRFAEGFDTSEYSVLSSSWKRRRVTLEPSPVFCYTAANKRLSWNIKSKSQARVQSVVSSRGPSVRTYVFRIVNLRGACRNDVPVQRAPRINEPLAATAFEARAIPTHIEMESAIRGFIQMLLSSKKKWVNEFYRSFHDIGLTIKAIFIFN